MDLLRLQAIPCGSLELFNKDSRCLAASEQEHQVMGYWSVKGQNYVVGSWSTRKHRLQWCFHPELPMHSHTVRRFTICPIPTNRREWYGNWSACYFRAWILWNTFHWTLLNTISHDISVNNFFWYLKSPNQICVRQVNFRYDYVGIRNTTVKALSFSSRSWTIRWVSRLITCNWPMFEYLEIQD